MKQIPFSKPDINDKDLQSVLDVINSGWLAHGEYSEKLEKLLIIDNFLDKEHWNSIQECVTSNAFTWTFVDSLNYAQENDDAYFAQTTLVNNPNIIRVSGGKERVDSVLSGLQAINDSEWVLVHDAARPCITHDDIDKLIKQCLDNNTGGLLAVPVVDTMKLASKNNENEAIQVDKTINRSSLWHAFTPQMFKVKELKQAIEQAQAKGLIMTDESSAIESVGLTCLLVSGRRDNIKITRPEDLVLADFYLKQQQIEQNKG